MSKFERLGVLPILLLGASLLVVGLAAMTHIVNNWWPFDVARLDLVRATALDRADPALLLAAANIEIVLAFLAVLLTAVTGLALPLVYVLNKRFRSDHQPPPFLVILRQAMWVGVWVAFCTWLHMNRVLGAAAAALVAVVLFLFEALLQVRTRAAAAPN